MMMLTGISCWLKITYTESLHINADHFRLQRRILSRMQNNGNKKFSFTMIITRTYSDVIGVWMVTNNSVIAQLLAADVWSGQRMSMNS